MTMKILNVNVNLVKCKIWSLQANAEERAQGEHRSIIVNLNSANML